MTDLALLRHLFGYGDWANDQLLAAASPLAAAQPDQPFDIGPAVCGDAAHPRWRGRVGWRQARRDRAEVDGREREPAEPAAIAARFAEVRALCAMSSFRDSSAVPCARPRAALPRQPRQPLQGDPVREMLVQGHVHSTHHRRR